MAIVTNVDLIAVSLSLYTNESHFVFISIGFVFGNKQIPPPSNIMAVTDLTAAPLAKPKGEVATADTHTDPLITEGQQYCGHERTLITQASQTEPLLCAVDTGKKIVM